jgi:hypothetical protein
MARARAKKDSLVDELERHLLAVEMRDEAEETRLKGDTDKANKLLKLADQVDDAADVEAEKRARAEEKRKAGELPAATNLLEEADEVKKLAAGHPREDLALAGLIAVTGFTIGPMGTGRCRLYLKPEMNEFVEFADRDVMGKKDIDAAQFPPIGGVIMWLRRGAQVTYTRVTSQQVQADLLSGAIAQAYQTAPSLPPFLGAPGRPGNGAVGANGNGGGGDVVYFYSGPDSNGTHTSGC